MIRVTLYIFVNAKWQAFALECVSGLSFMCYPAGSAFVSRLTPADEQGTAQGALGGIRGFDS